MWKCKSESVARELARKHGLLCGMCMIDGAWYVGTRDQLSSLSCKYIR